MCRVGLFPSCSSLSRRPRRIRLRRLTSSTCRAIWRPCLQGGGHHQVGASGQADSAAERNGRLPHHVPVDRRGRSSDCRDGNGLRAGAARAPTPRRDATRRGDVRGGAVPLPVQDLRERARRAPAGLAGAGGGPAALERAHPAHAGSERRHRDDGARGEVVRQRRRGRIPSLRRRRPRRRAAPGMRYRRGLAPQRFTGESPPSTCP